MITDELIGRSYTRGHLPNLVRVRPDVFLCEMRIRYFAAIVKRGRPGGSLGGITELLISMLELNGTADGKSSNKLWFETGKLPLNIVNKSFRCEMK